MLIEETTLVSILMTAYNRERYIAEAIESVLASTYKNWELIIVDDGSKDDTFQIASGFAEKNSRIRLYKNEKNLGDYPNRNRAASYAQGKYIVIVDSDDRMMSETLVKWVACMEEKKASFGIFHHIIHVEPVLVSPDVIIPYHFFTKPVLSFGPIATIIRNDYFKSIKGFPEKYGPANDMYYNLKAANNTDTLVFPFPLVDYRVHEGQEFNNKYGYLYNNYLYLRDALKELDLPLDSKEKRYLLHKNKRRFVVNVFRYFFKTGKTGKTLKAIKAAGFRMNDLIDALITKHKPAVRSKVSNII